MERRQNSNLLSFLFCMSLRVLLPFLALLALAHSQEGFISIDCGYTEGPSYDDEKANLTYTDDSQFIEDGRNEILYTNPFARQYGNVRSFPNNTRNCYELSRVKSGGKYLIRAGFYYGNYDGKNSSPTFDLRLGVNFWTTVKMGSDGRFVSEIITVSTRENIHVCLVNTGNGTPFISLLELRPLPVYTYPYADGSLSLVSQNRWNYGVQGQLRYPDDPYDRIWAGVIDTYNTLNTTSRVEVDAGDAFQVPWEVLRTAVYGDFFYNNIIQVRANPGERIYVTMHFAELLQLNSNDSRVFNILNLGLFTEVLFANYSPPYLKANHKEVKNVSDSDGYYKIAFYGTSTSTLRYIINALESYTVKPMNESQTDMRDASAIEDIKKTFRLTRNWESDPCSPRQYTWQGLNCSYEDSRTARIICLNLSSSGLDGEIPTSIGQLTALRSLDISNNNLKGSIPASLGGLLYLQFLNLSGNEAIRVIPRSLCERASNGRLTISFIDWPEKCEKSTSNKNKVILPAVVVVSIAIINVLAVSFWIFHRKRKARSSRGEQNKFQIETEENCYKSENPTFTFEEIKQITQNFRHELGKGGFGTVYLGCLRDGTKVAVKVLSSSSSQGNKEFEAEVRLLARVHHKNLVTLLGYCDDAQHLSLAYEYMDNGTLRDHISGDTSNPNRLNWSQRVNIALQAAQGLDYLHNGCKPPIVHRDIKSTNILINGDFVAKIADFGLSRAFKSENSTHISSKVAGTPGYLDPLELHTYGLNEKSDVYSFGVVLLEILTGQPPFVISTEKTHIIKWVSLKLPSGDIRNIIDPTLQGQFNINMAWKITEVALSCTSTNIEERISMSNVVMQLKQCLEMDDPQHTIEDASSTNLSDETPSGSDPQSTPLSRYIHEEINHSSGFFTAKQMKGNDTFNVKSFDN